MYIDDSFINKRVSDLRNQKGVSARDMSLSIGQSENYINKIENGKALPSMHGLILICEYFEITLQEFFDVENKNPEKFKNLMDEIKSLDEPTLDALLTIVRGLNKNK